MALTTWSEGLHHCVDISRVVVILTDWGNVSVRQWSATHGWFAFIAVSLAVLPFLCITMVTMDTYYSLSRVVFTNLMVSSLGVDWFEPRGVIVRLFKIPSPSPYNNMPLSPSVGLSPAVGLSRRVVLTPNYTQLGKFICTVKRIHVNCNSIAPL